MKVWRNSEGREFPVDQHGVCKVGDYRVARQTLRELGYELVDVEPEAPEEFEVECWAATHGNGYPMLRDPSFIPGKTYLVREVKR